MSLSVVPSAINNNDYSNTRRINNSSDEKEEFILRFDHQKEFAIHLIEEFLDHCSDGALSIEVWGHRVPGIRSSKPGCGVPDLQLKMCRSLADRWAELKCKIELWVEIQELDENGEYISVDVLP